ncbi:MAG: chorismate mutase, partial [Candidatus Margulisiibacteriota bacterium]
MALRGIRGAITVGQNSDKKIVAATEILLRKVVAANKIKVGDIAAAIFSTTHDLSAEFPAVAARNLGWTYTPLLCTNEINVPGA